MSFLWTSGDLIKAMDGRPFGQMPEGITGISIDTRSLNPGEAFFAIKGETLPVAVPGEKRSFFGKIFGRKAA